MREVVSDDIPRPTTEDLRVSPSGAVTVTDTGWPHPLAGQHIGVVSTEGTPVWVTPDGMGGTAATTRGALAELLDNTLSEYPSESDVEWDQLINHAEAGGYL